MLPTKRLKTSSTQSSTSSSRPTTNQKQPQQTTATVGCQSQKDVNVSLEDKSLWEEFHKLTNEMIVTKNGRRMFPVLRVHISGLEANSFYSVYLDFVKMNGASRWKFMASFPSPSFSLPLSSSSFSSSSPVLSSPPSSSSSSPPSSSSSSSSSYLHPDSPNFGKHWTNQVVTFSKVKVTNKVNCSGDQVFLDSLHKYLPRVTIVKIISNKSDDARFVGSFTFGETSFIAVTAYQNEEITNLKVKYNPFAKGFQERLNISYNKNNIN
ncbi:hypothetical protein HELRODRAFT_84628 [Helobdella robusta]|uniref:T-box domain-containing protein n=1 Tax=Helobdella robusta TaxID=6412 RepID=T1G5L1_HELRO|nr:hypothetical protein HELRODRAFT_84628 [Helobdella robusta]ESN98407.1 hypothetical protein HELRODRAFT_84628 [Helobdella robusta]